MQQEIRGINWVQNFDREKSPIVPTIRGKKLIGKIKRIIREVDELNPRFLADGLAGKFKVGIIPTIAPYLTPLFIRKFEANYPNISLEIIERQTEQILEELEQEEIDLGILATPLSNSKYFENVLYYENFLLFWERT